MAHAGHRTRSDDVDTTDIQIEHPICSHHGKTAVLGERHWIAGRSLRQIGFVKRQFAAANVQAVENNRMVYLRNERRRNVVVVVIEHTDIQIPEFGKTVEACSREANGRINSTGHLIEHDKGVPATHGASSSATTRTGGSWISVLARVSTRSDGLLELFHVCQFSLARRQRFWRINMGGLIGQQLRRKLKATVTTQGQFGAVLQMNGDRSSGSRFQLLAGKQPVTFDKRPTSTVVGDCEDLSDYFADNTD